MQIYRCSVCGNIVAVLHPGVGKLVCCGREMELLEEKEEETGQEKHIPVIEEGEGKARVRIGSVPHPMEEKHYIEWIEIVADGAILRKFLSPGDKPEAEFEVSGGVEGTRTYCNVHGLWRA